jgi:hypothetical protein
LRTCIGGQTVTEKADGPSYFIRTTSNGFIRVCSFPLLNIYHPDIHYIVAAKSRQASDYEASDIQDSTQLNRAFPRSTTCLLEYLFSKDLLHTLALNNIALVAHYERSPQPIGDCYSFRRRHSGCIKVKNRDPDPIICPTESGNKQANHYRRQPGS